MRRIKTQYRRLEGFKTVVVVFFFLLNHISVWLCARETEQHNQAVTHIKENPFNKSQHIRKSNTKSAQTRASAMCVDKRDRHQHVAVPKVNIFELVLTEAEECYDNNC